MSIQAWAAEMARYSLWQNQVLFALCNDLSDPARRQDRGLFFGSIHATLDHMLLVDGALKDYAVTEVPPSDFDPCRSVADAYEDLASGRRRFDAEMVALFDRMPEDWLSETMTVSVARLGQDRTFPRHFLFAQMFNHGTHHRAQVTTALHGMGIDYGITDMPYNPLSLY